MNIFFLWPFIAFGLVTFLHYLSLKIQDRHQFYTRAFGQRVGFWIHFGVTALLWVYLGILLSDNNIPGISKPLLVSFQGMKVVSNILNVTGIILIFWSFLLLGIRRMWGVRYFEHQTQTRIEERGPYRWLNNPMYNGFSLLFLASAFMDNSLVHALLALESVALFHFLAKFENKDIKA